MNLLDIIDSFSSQENRIAHMTRESTLTYKELKSQSDALAVYLNEKYGDSRTPIVVYGHKQHGMLVCFLACVKSGHAYIPVDSSLPAERIRDIISGSEAELVLDVGSLDFLINGDILKTEQIDQIIRTNYGMVPDKKHRVKPEDPYYIIYTSGSTGKPKGVQITLACLESFVNWGLTLCKADVLEKSVFLNQAPFSFDLSVMDLYLSLVTGSTLFSIDKNMTANMKELFEYLKLSNTGIWVSTPSFAEMCLADKSFNESLLSELKLFLFCGEVLTQSCAQRLYERFPESRVINTYGPTEATVAVTSVEIDEKMYLSESPLPVGYVKDDCRLIIVDSDGNEAEEGKTGEILIAGDSVSIGYYKNPEMTEKKFSKALVNGEIKRCYRTGDEGYLRDGLLYYCGRIDTQVKLNGYRIELEDIENNLRKIDLVKNAVVLPVSTNGKIQYLAAAVTLSRQLEEKEFKIGLMIKEELRKLLPEYMVPRKIAIHDILPMTPNGKVNRKLLLEQLM